MCSCVHTCMYMGVCLCVFVYMVCAVCMCLCIYLCIYLYIHAMVYVYVCVCNDDIICIGAVDFSDNYEELSLHSTTFDKLQRKVQAADVTGKKKLANLEGVLSNFFTVHIEHSASFRIQRVISTSS